MNDKEKEIELKQKKKGDHRKKRCRSFFASLFTAHCLLATDG